MDKEEVKRFMKEDLKKFLELDEPMLVSKVAPKIAPYVKIIYIIGLVLMAMFTLGAIVTLLSSFSEGLISIIFIVVEFILFRMFCEFLLTHGK